MNRAIVVVLLALSGCGRNEPPEKTLSPSSTPAEALAKVKATGGDVCTDLIVLDRVRSFILKNVPADDTFKPDRQEAVLLALNADFDRSTARMKRVNAAERETICEAEFSASGTALKSPHRDVVTFTAQPSEADPNDFAVSVILSPAVAVVEGARLDYGNPRWSGEPAEPPLQEPFTEEH